MKVLLRRCVSVFRVWLTPLRFRVLRGVPFSLALLLLIAISIPSCLNKPKTVLNGGHLIHNGYESYWPSSSFPIKILVPADLPEEYQEAAFDAASIWNSTTGTPVFSPMIIDFKSMKPKGCGWFSTAIKDIKTTGLWTGYYIGKSSAVCSGLVSVQANVSKVAAFKIYLHEYGHALGLTHDPGDIRSIMYPIVYTDVVQYIMPDDVLSVVSMTKDEFTPLPKSINSDIRELIRHL